MVRMVLSKVLAALETIAPTRHAESWDNVGLLVGDPAQDVTAAILAIDYTPEVAAERERLNCDLVIAYHPPIFNPLKRINAGSVIFDAIRSGVAIYSPHTALDVADGGTNDMLADAIGIGARQPLRMIQPKSMQHKLVFFVPKDAVDKVTSALFAAGAGVIGKYSSCSFQSEGTGTFFGEAGTHPSVGESGKLERTSEVKVETVVPISKTEVVIRSLRASHPYEEPAFDLQVLAAAPEGLGMGRIGSLEQPMDRAQVFDRIKRELKLDHLLIAGPRSGLVHRAAVCAGACGDHLDDAISQKADLYLTGEMRHHDAIKAASAGLTVVCTLHSNSERAVLRRLRDRLSKEAPDVEFHLSESDRDPFSVM
jgi:dinuclear metal center YbgI/SA1388 family protein